jgi:hypothetical protein
MKTLLILLAATLASVLVVMHIYRSEDTLKKTEYLNRHTIDSLKKEIRMGPKPYCLTHQDHPRTTIENDSVRLYFSHLTRGEILEVQNGITENVVLKRYLDSLILFKDSLDKATKGYVGGIDE